jgi:heme/copper-type cytochrome/quinol oxidase subunit 4
MSLQSFHYGLTNRRRTSLLSFYMAALVSATAISVVGWSPSFHKQVLAVAVAGAAATIWFLLRFLHSNDERERQINYRALTFAFTGTLIFSLAIGFLQSFGFHSVSWLGIPALMVILWSLGLILYSWRYR